MEAGVIFTDIDGVLNPNYKRQWSRKSIAIFNRICADFNLRPVVSSTWRTNHTREKLQEIFDLQGVKAEILDFTPWLKNEDRGLEIRKWLDENPRARYVVVDDSVRQIEPYVDNVVACRGWIGLEEEHYEQIKEILNGQDANQEGALHQQG